MWVPGNTSSEHSLRSHVLTRHDLYYISIHWSKVVLYYISIKGGSLPVTYRSALGQWPLQDTVPMTCCNSMLFKTGGECFFWQPLVLNQNLQETVQKYCYLFICALHLTAAIIQLQDRYLLMSWCMTWSISVFGFCYGFARMIELIPGLWPSIFLRHRLPAHLNYVWYAGWNIAHIVWNSGIEPYPSLQVDVELIRKWQSDT